jgi:hypothetical protein
VSIKHNPIWDHHAAEKSLKSLRIAMNLQQRFDERHELASRWDSLMPWQMKYSPLAQCRMRKQRCDGPSPTDPLLPCRRCCQLGATCSFTNTPLEAPSENGTIASTVHRVSKLQKQYVYISRSRFIINSEGYMTMKSESRVWSRLSTN